MTEESPTNYEVFLDEEHIAHVRYRDDVGLDTTIAVYQALEALLEENLSIIDQVRGCIFDFSAITSLEVEAMVTAARKSVSFRLKYGHLFAAIPTATVVHTTEQEVMVSSAMKLARNIENPRFRLVKSIDQAKAFFNEYHSRDT
jgi:hypothetical protein